MTMYEYLIDRAELCVKLGNQDGASKNKALARGLTIDQAEYLVPVSPAYKQYCTWMDQAKQNREWAKNPGSFGAAYYLGTAEALEKQARELANAFFI